MGVPFCYIVYTLFVGLSEAQAAQPANVRSQVKWACWATVFSWCTYPVVYTFPIVAVQVGYTVSDIISKCGVGYLVYRIGLAKSANMLPPNEVEHQKLNSISTDE